MDLWYKHRFRVDLLASGAGVADQVVFDMFSDKPVKREEAQKVLATLSTLYDQEYTLTTVSVVLASL
jgi:hypothetical protein